MRIIGSSAMSREVLWRVSGPALGWRNRLSLRSGPATSLLAQNRPVSGGDARLGRLGALGPDRMAASLAFLAGYDPPTFDAILDATEPCSDDSEAETEPCCTVCSGPVGIFLAD